MDPGEVDLVGAKPALREVPEAGSACPDAPGPDVDSSNYRGISESKGETLSSDSDRLTSPFCFRQNFYIWVLIQDQSGQQEMNRRFTVFRKPDNSP